MADAEVFGSEPHPRALLVGWSPDAGVPEEILASFPTYRQGDNLSEVHQEEWDVVVIGPEIQYTPYLHGSLYVISFGSCYPDLRPSEYRLGTFAQECRVPTKWLGTDVYEAIRRDLVPMYSGVGQKKTIHVCDGFISRGPDSWHPMRPKQSIDPLVEVGGEIGAAILERHNATTMWVLPPFLSPESMGVWVRLALASFSLSDPVRFPAPPSWWQVSTEWQVQDQREKHSELASAKQKRQDAVAVLDREVHAAAQAADEADRNALRGPLRVLTEDGDGLVEAVHEMLEELGFRVENRDLVNPPNQRKEDLRASDPDDGDWLALIEVKGYQKGAKVNDLFRLEKWTTAYAIETGSRPRARWHIVNHFRAAPPSGRPMALTDDDLRDFSEDGGLLIDSRELFRLWRQVKSGECSAAEARAALRSASGRLRAPIPLGE